MKKTLRSTLTAILLSSVAIVPAATISVMVTADAAYAKSDKSKGGGGGKSSSSRGGGAKDKSTRGKSGDRTERGGKKKHGGFERLFGKGKAKKSETKTSRAQSKPAKTKVKERKTVVASSPKAPKRPEREYKNGMHPSELGKVNGMLNANENAILAHIRNGNMNGTIGLMAAATMASYEKDEAEKLLNSDLAGEYAAAEEAAEKAGYASLQEYFDSGNDVKEINDALDAIGTADLETALGDDYASYEEYEAAVEDDPDLRDEDIEAAYEAAQAGYDADTASAFEDAEGAEQAYDDALGDILDAWNKGDADSENADDVIAAIESRIGSYERVGEAIESLESGCDDEGACDAPEEKEAESSEEEIEDEEVAEAN